MNRTQTTKNNGRGQRGASIAIALLLLLVCALLTSIILAATSGVSGRHKDLGLRDQHYYSATSAAKFLTSELEKSKGDNVVFECSQITTSTETVTYNINGEKIPPSEGSKPKVEQSWTLTRDDGTDITDSGYSPTYSEQIALEYLTRGSTVSAQTIFSNLTTPIATTPKPDPVDTDYELKFKNRDDVLHAKVKQSIDLTDGTVSLNIVSGDPEEASNKDNQYYYYSVKATCPADIDIEQNTLEELEVSGEDATQNTFTRIEKTTQTVTYRITMSWSLESMVNTEGAE